MMVSAVVFQKVGRFRMMEINYSISHISYFMKKIEHRLRGKNNAFGDKR